MTTETIQYATTEQQDFQTGQVLTIVNGHFIHDIYTAFVAPLLPVLMERLSLSLTLAGSLTAISAVPCCAKSFHRLSGG